jgi:hypothetical protein
VLTGYCRSPPFVVRSRELRPRTARWCTCLIWYGDILTLYALVGFSLLWFRERSNAQLARWVAVLFALPVVQYGALMLLFGGGPPDPAAA